MVSLRQHYFVLHIAKQVMQVLESIGVPVSYDYGDRFAAGGVGLWLLQDPPAEGLNLNQCARALEVQLGFGVPKVELISQNGKRLITVDFWERPMTSQESLALRARLQALSDGCQRLTADLVNIEAPLTVPEKLALLKAMQVAIGEVAKQLDLQLGDAELPPPGNSPQTAGAD